MKLAIVFLIIFTIHCKSQNTSSCKNLNVSLHDLQSRLSLHEDYAFQLVFGSPNFSFDRFFILDDKFIGYDETKAIFYLINTTDNILLDQIDLKKEKEVNKKSPIKKSFETEFFHNYISDSGNSGYFSNYWDDSPFVQLNDSVFFIGFFKFYMSKHYNQQFNIVVNQNKLQAEYVPYYSSAFEILKEKGSILNLSNAMDLCELFTFQNYLYCYFPYSPWYKEHRITTDSCFYKRIHDIVVRILPDKSFELITKGNKDQPEYYEFIEKDKYLFQFSIGNDSLIIKDSRFKSIYTTKLSALPGFEQGIVKMYKDPTTSKIYAVQRYRIDELNVNNKPLGELCYKIIELEFKDNILITKFVKEFSFNRRIFIKFFRNNKLYFTIRNPQYNTFYLYNIDLNHQDIYQYDTVNVSIKHFNTIDALYFQNLLDPYKKTAYQYVKTPGKINRIGFRSQTGNNNKYHNKSIEELFVSIQKCLIEKNYDYIYSKLLIFEEYEINTLEFLSDNSILKHDSALYNYLFFEIISEDISELCNKHSELELDFSGNTSILKTYKGRYYTVVKINGSYYLGSSIGYESSEYLESNDRKEFAKKYGYLRYINKRCDKDRCFQISDTIIAGILPDNLLKLCFPDVIYQPDSFPQNNVTELFNSIQKAINEGRIDYIKAKLMMYPLPFINECNETNSCELLLQDTSITFEVKLINKYLDDDYEKIVISKNIIIHKYTLEQNLSCFQYIIRKKGKWFLYSNIIVMC